MGKHLLGIVVLLASCAALGSECWAVPVSRDGALRAASALVQAEQARPGRAGTAMAPPRSRSPAVVKASVQVIRPVRYHGAVVAYVAELAPRGFLILSADTDIRPIVGYSPDGRFVYTDSSENVLLHLIQWDMSARTLALRSRALGMADLARRNNWQWQRYLRGGSPFSQARSPIQQWPPAPQEGWMDDLDDWHQGDPYNRYCPTDPITGERSLVGCTATAMGQILTYWQHPQSIHFSDIPWPLGDAYPSLMPPSPMWIDDFASLNLDLADVDYEHEAPQVAFACGVSLQMAYSSKHSLAWPRASSYLRLGYGSASSLIPLLGDVFYGRLAANMKAGWPAQLVIHPLDPLQLQLTHSLVVDGYRESGEFHLRFGWTDTTVDGWYFLPEGMPAPYSVVSWAVLDICPYQGWNQWGADERNSFSTPYSAPLEDTEKWAVSCPDAYRFTGLAVGTGNRIFATCSPRDVGSTYTPSVYVIDQYGVKQKEILLEGENGETKYPAQRAPSAGHTNPYVFVPTSSGRIYRVDTVADSAAVSFELPGAGEFVGSPKVDENGDLYACTSNTVYCLTPSGTVRWSFVPPHSGWIFRGTVAVDAARDLVYIPYYDMVAGTAYLGCITRDDGSLVLEKPFQDVQAVNYSASTPSVGPDGTVYVGCKGTLYALDPDSSLAVLWQREFAQHLMDYAPTVSADGRQLYMSYWKQDGTALAYNVGALDTTDNGRAKWEISFPDLGPFDWIMRVYATANDVVCFTVLRDNGLDPDTFTLYAYRDLGDTAEYVWHRELGVSGGDVAFGPGNTLYVVPLSPFGGTICAVSEGERGDPHGAAMGFQDNAPPQPPADPVPAVGSGGVSTSVILSWTCSDPEGNGLTFDVFMGNNGALAPVATGLATTSLAVEDLAPGTGYVWRVVASDGQAVTEGPVWSFQTEAPPRPQVLLEVHPNECAQGYGGGPKLGTECWTSSGLTGPFYLWKQYQFDGSASLWIQVCAQNFNLNQNPSGRGDLLQLKIDGQVPDDVWGIMTGWSGIAQWCGDNEHGNRYTLEFRPTGLTPGQHVLKLSAKETPILWWVKVVDLGSSGL